MIRQLINRTTIRQASLCLSMAAMLAGCGDFLEEYSQDKYRVNSYTDLDELLIGDAYLPVHPSKYATNTQNIGHFIHFLADEMEEQNKGRTTASSGVETRQIKNAVFGYFTWQKRVGQNETFTGFETENKTWKETYRLINVANNILESVDDVPQQTNDEKQGAARVKGEASFLRAAYYFWLTNLYGKAYNPTTATHDLAVPLKTEAKVNDILYSRNSVQELYDQILSDLTVAEACLKDVPSTHSIYRADIRAVWLLASRVHLYMQHWEEAARYADLVIQASPNLVNMNNEQMKLTKESPEVIFSMGGHEIPCNMDYKYQSFRVDKALYDAYTDEDLRRTQWWWTYDNFIGYTKVPEGTKYSSSTYPPTNNRHYTYIYNNGLLDALAPVSDKFLYRTAEAYLNKAEAEACLRHEDEAKKSLYVLRSNRYKAGADYTTTATGDNLVEEIREERRKELALEGHRWFDLRRYAVSQVAPYSKELVHRYTYYTAYNKATMVETHVFTLPAGDPAYTLPIPQEVLEYNVGMQNNERPDRPYTVE